MCVHLPTFPKMFAPTRKKIKPIAKIPDSRFTIKRYPAIRFLSANWATSQRNTCRNWFRNTIQLILHTTMRRKLLNSAEEYFFTNIRRRSLRRENYKIVADEQSTFSNDETSRVISKTAASFKADSPSKRSSFTAEGKRGFLCPYWDRTLNLFICTKLCFSGSKNFSLLLTILADFKAQLNTLKLLYLNILFLVCLRSYYTWIYIAFYYSQVQFFYYSFNLNIFFIPFKVTVNSLPLLQRLY